VKVALKEAHWSGKTYAILPYEECIYRPCLHLDVNKGSYTPGRGYTEYYKDPNVVCLKNHRDGCPYPLPDPDPENMRCCPAPTFAKSRGNSRRQRCKVCGVWHSGAVLELVKTLEHHPYTMCSHERVKADNFATNAGWWCPSCNLWWDDKPKAFQCGETALNFCDRRFEASDEKLGL
jgi:hypothetical protein